VPGLVIVRYGELGLKSTPVRREFERVLERNILAQFVRAGAPCRVRSDHGHLYVEASDVDRAAALPRRVFGVTSVSPAVELGGDLSALTSNVPTLAASQLEGHASFAVRARRTGTHSFTSQDVGREVGGAILERFPGLKVDLERPEVEVFVEVRGPRTYLYFDKLPGPGGLPLGVAGRVVALVDSVRGGLGAFMMMKRGCRASVVTTVEGEAMARDVLAEFDTALDIRPTRTSDEVEATLRQAAASGHADGVVLPLSVDECASARERWQDIVVFSPTVGLTDEEVASRWKVVTSLLG
jgi:thiamine biosynthesis protein ThiI